MPFSARLEATTADQRLLADLLHNCLQDVLQAASQQAAERAAAMRSATLAAKLHAIEKHLRKQTLHVPFSTRLEATTPKAGTAAGKAGAAQPTAQQAAHRLALYMFYNIKPSLSRSACYCCCCLLLLSSLTRMSRITLCCCHCSLLPLLVSLKAGQLAVPKHACVADRAAWLQGLHHAGRLGDSPVPLSGTARCIHHTCCLLPASALPCRCTYASILSGSVCAGS